MHSRQAQPRCAPARESKAASHFLNKALLFLIVALVAAIIRKAWMDLDVTWDSFAYHMPLAAIRAGLVPQSRYHLSAFMNALYEGFPALPDLIQGSLWRLTHRPQATNFAGLIGLGCLVTTVARTFRIPATHLLLGYLAIPVVLIQSTSTYVDLFGNSFLCILILLTFSAWLWPEKVTLAQVLSVAAAFAIALNTKVGYLLVAPPWLIIYAILLYRTRPVTLKAQWISLAPTLRGIYVAALLLLVASGFYNEVKDEALYQNPVYPARINIGPLHLKGTLNAGDEPHYLAHAPQPVKWLLSVLEFRAFEGRAILWVNSQGNVPSTSPASRMGGFFAPSVLFNILWLFLLQRKTKHLHGTKPLVFIAVLTLLTMGLPASQESRYYMYWFMCLITTNLLLINNSLAESESSEAKLIFLGTTASFLLFVLCATGFVYLTRSGWTPKSLRVTWGVDEQLRSAHIQNGETVCVLGKLQTSFLYAPVFHPELDKQVHYSVMEAYTPSDCNGARPIP